MTFYILFLLVLMIIQDIHTEEKKLISVLVTGYEGPLENAVTGSLEDVETLEIRNSTLTESNLPDVLEFPNLKYLTIEHSIVKKLNKEVFMKCCPKLNKLELQFNGEITTEDLKAVGSLSLESIWISEVDLPKLEASVFTNGHLKELILIFDSIQSIDNDAFSHVPNLEKLFLCGNFFKNIPKVALAPLKKLKALAMVDNNLEKISTSDIPDLPSLEVLVVPKNPLKEIDLEGVEEVAPKLKNMYVGRHWKDLVMKRPKFLNIVETPISFFEMISL